MNKIDVFSKAGKELTYSNANVIKVPQPGAIVKVNIPTNSISGAVKSGNNLVILQKNGEKITLEDFFPAGGNAEPTKLVIADGEYLYQANYDSDNFSGLEFSAVSSMDEVISGEGTEQGVNPAVWIVPLVVAGVAGIAIAASNSGGGGGGGGGSTKPVTPVNPDDKSQAKFDEQVAKTKAELTVTKLDALKAAVEALKAEPTAENLAKVQNAKAALAEELAALQTKVTAFEVLTKAAAENKLNTTEAKALLEKIASEMGDATTVSENADTIAKVVSDLLDYVSGLDTAFTTMKDVLAASEAAKTQPSDTNVQSVREALAALQSKLAELKAGLEISLKAAAEKGIATDTLKAQADAALNKVESEIGTITSNLEIAEANLAAVNDAFAKVTTYNEKVLAAENKVKEANLAVEAAKNAKEQAIKSNSLDKVDEINAQIKAANNDLINAKQALNELTTAREDAIKAIEKISPDVAASHKPNTDNLKDVNVTPSEPIEKGIIVKEAKGIFEAIKDGLASLKDLANSEFKEFVDKVLASKPVEVIKDMIQGAKDAISNIGSTIWTAIKAPVEAFKAGFKGVKDFISETGNIIKSGIKFGIDAVKEAIAGGFKIFKDGISDVYQAVKKTALDAIKDMKFTDWINPIKVIGLGKDIVISGIKAGIKATWDAVKAIPGKGFEFVVQKIKDGAKLISDHVSTQFSTVKDSVQEIVKILHTAFIKNPIDTFVKPVIDALNPFKAIPKWGSIIIESIKDGIDILKSLKDIPGKGIEIIKDMISDILGSSKGDKVSEGDGNEIKAFLKEITDALETHTDEVAKVSDGKAADEIKVTDEVKAADEVKEPAFELNELLSENNTGINLDAIAPKEETVNVSVPSEAQAETQVFVNQPMIDDQANLVSMVA